MPPKRVHPSLGTGRDYDVVNAEVVLHRMTVRDGRITLPDGMQYELLVLPEREDMDLAVLQKVAELVAAVGVIVSLLLLVYSLERNTAALQGGTENLLFDSHTALASRMVDDPSLVEIRLKVRHGQDLTEVEAVRWDYLQSLLLDVWAMAYMRHEEDLLDERQWRAWDTFFSAQFRDSDLRLTAARWEALVGGFDPGFWAHVKEAAFGNRGQP